MQQTFSGIQFVVGDRNVLEQMVNIQVLPLFSERVLDFLDCLSKRLMDSNEAKKYPDVISFAFGSDVHLYIEQACPIRMAVKG